MAIERYATTLPSAVNRYFTLFSRNAKEGKRYLITLMNGQHLVGAPATAVPFDSSKPDVAFRVTTALAHYEVPFKDLAWADELAPVAGLRPSDGMPPVPEPCQAPPQREKHQKFKILDAPALLAKDMQEQSNSNLSLLYVDVDGFKAVNTKYTETVVDNELLPDFQRMIDSLTQGHGFSYAEGGDEIIVLLINATELIGLAFAESIRQTIEAHEFKIGGQAERLTVSIGMAVARASTNSMNDARQWANDAKKVAKDSGKNCIIVMDENGPRRVSLVRQ